MEEINYAIKYKNIYIKVCEFIVSIKSIATYKEIAIPLVEKIIKNYNRFNIVIKDENERRVCDDYIESLKKLVKIMYEKVRFYEKYQGREIDIT